MKQYEKKYENVFSEDIENSRGTLKLDKISVEDMTVDYYSTLFGNFLTDFYIELFNGCVRLSWLRRKFKYYDKKTVLPMQKNCQLLNYAFVKFLRRNIGKDIQIITRSKFFSRLETYFEELFPGFMDGNPFENPEYYKFPFSNISIEFLLVVYQLDDRIELLKYADDNKMSYATFLDYVINHVSCANEDLGRQRYTMKLNEDRNYPFYVKDTDKNMGYMNKKLWKKQQRKN